MAEKLISYLQELNVSLKLLKANFPVSGIFRAGGILDNKRLLSRNYLFNLATFSPANNGISARSESFTDWKLAVTTVRTINVFKSDKNNSMKRRNEWLNSFYHQQEQIM